MSVFRWLTTGGAASSRINSKGAATTATAEPLRYVAAVRLSVWLGRRGGRRRLGVAAGGLLLSGGRCGLLRQFGRLVRLAVEIRDDVGAFLATRDAGEGHVGAGHHRLGVGQVNVEVFRRPVAFLGLHR